MTNSTTTRLPIISVGVKTRLECAGSNPENAEIDNPRGEFYEPFATIVAQDADGREYALCGTYRQVRDQYEAEALYAVLATKIEAAGSIDPDLWRFTRWTYGSAGWDAQELDNEIDDAERDGEIHPRASERGLWTRE